MRPELDYAKLRDRRLYLAAPLYGNQLTYGFHVSVCQLIHLCLRHGIKLGQKYVGCDSLVPRARNTLVHYFLRSDCTDLLFVDSDITFRPEDALSLLACNEPIVGGVYPRKQHDWSRIAAAARSGIPPTSLPHYGVVPVLNWRGSGDFPLDSLIEVRHLGTGFLRIRRDVFSTMISTLGDSLAYDYSAEQSEFAGESGHDFFPCGPDIRYPLGSGGRQYLSEDWAFCELAAACGFKVHAAPWISLTHSGYCDFHGDLSILDEVTKEELDAATTPSA